MISATDLYKDPKALVNERVQDLLNRMTLKEKVGQIMQLNQNDSATNIAEAIKERHLGSALQVTGEMSNDYIKLSLQSRLGIPLLLAIDAIHGHSFWKGATIFPTQLAAACSWDEGLLEEMASVTAKEAYHTGVSWTFSPVLCLTRDLRWGRVGETFGEDPYLIERFAKAMIQGYQGDSMNEENKILACAKHYAGYSETQGGRDASEADLSRRKLKSFFLPPFEAVAKMGVGSFMTGYQSIDGLPSTANKWLLRETLKEDWNYEDGFLVTDYDNVGTMVTQQKICPDYKSAAALAIQCGNDMIMQTPEFYQGCIDAVKEGLLEEDLLDESVARVLKVKFKLGLFENPRFYDKEKVELNVATNTNRESALQLARESAVLLENDGLLPLSANSIKTIAVIGPNADNDLTQLGDWSLGTGQAGEGKHPRESTITVLDGLKNRFQGEVLYEKGCDIGSPSKLGSFRQKGITSNNSNDHIPAAVAAAKKADVAVVVLGDEKYLIGEYASTATLELQGAQEQLLREIKATGTPTIVVLINSKPLALSETVYTSNAVIEQFNPGMLGGQALAELLFGDFNPSGKLTTSFPYHVGQQPIYYSQVRGQHGDRYADMTQEPLYAFGEGKSYTTFEYGDIHIDKNNWTSNETLEVTIPVTNTGKMDGNEIVQAYISIQVTSATWVNMELKSFAKEFIPAGETKDITLQIPLSSCSIVNAEEERVVEPGTYELLIGPSSKKSDLQSVTFEIE